MFGLSRGAVEQRTAPTYTWDQYLRIYTEGMTTGGAPSVTNVDQALRNSALWASVLIKAKGIAGLPADVVRSVGGVRVPVTAPRVVTRPSAIVRAKAWRFQLCWSMFTDGNAFGDVVELDSFGRPSQIELLDPVSVTQREVERGIGTVTVGGARRRLWPHGDVWHVAGEMLAAGSPFALSPVKYAAQAIGTSLAAEDFGGAFLAEGGIPSAILSPEQDPGAEGAKRLKERFMAAVRGSREPVVLPRSTKYERIQVAPSDSQFLELMRFEVEQVARFTGVPPSMLFSSISGQNVTYANVTDSDLWYLKHTLSYPIDLVEEAISELLPQPQVYRLNRDAVLRAETLKRYEAHEVALRNRWRTVNEVRRLEDEAPLPGDEFDEPGVPPIVVPDEPSSSDEPRSAPFIGEFRNVVQLPQERDVQRAATPDVHVHNVVHVPEQRADAPVVNVLPSPVTVVNEVPVPSVTVTNEVPVPEVRVDGPTVNVTNDVPVPQLEVNVETPRVRHKFKRNADGQIVEATEEPM